MKIFLTIFEDKSNEPEKTDYQGNWAYETMIIKTLTKYYGERVASKVEDLLRERVK